MLGKEIFVDKVSGIVSYPVRVVVVAASPAHARRQVGQIALHGHIVLPSAEEPVEVLVVGGLLLHHQTAARQQIRKPVRGYCAIHIYLILILE